MRTPRLIIFSSLPFERADKSAESSSVQTIVFLASKGIHVCHCDGLLWEKNACSSIFWAVNLYDVLNYPINMLISRIVVCFQQAGNLRVVLSLQ